MKKIAAFVLLMLFPAVDVFAADTYAYTGSDGVKSTLSITMKKVSTPSGMSKLRTTGSWGGFASTAANATGGIFTFAWENYESDATAGTLHENNPAQGALFILAYAFPSSNCNGGASFFAVVEMSKAVSLSNLGSSISVTPLFGQICGTNVTSLTQYVLTKQ
jgi:hypothetical protein